MREVAQATLEMKMTNTFGASNFLMWPIDLNCTEVIEDKNFSGAIKMLGKKSVSGTISGIKFISNEHYYIISKQRFHIPLSPQQTDHFSTDVVRKSFTLSGVSRNLQGAPPLYFAQFMKKKRSKKQLVYSGVRSKSASDLNGNGKVGD